MKKGGATKGTKYMSKGGATKGTKYMAKGGASKGTKYMSRGGAAADAERSATGFGRIPSSVLAALAGRGAARGAKSILKGKRTNTRQQLKKLAKINKAAGKGKGIKKK